MGLPGKGDKPTDRDGTGELLEDVGHGGEAGHVEDPGREAEDGTQAQTAQEESAQKETAQEEQVRLNADVPKSLRKEVQMQAVREERDIREVLIDAVREYLSEHS